MFLTLMRLSLVVFRVLWLYPVRKFMQVSCRLALMRFVMLWFIWFGLMAGRPLMTGSYAAKTLKAVAAVGARLGNVNQLGIHVLALAATGFYAVVATFAILKIVDKVVGLRVTHQDETEGLDSTLHGEEGYAMSG